MNKVMLFFLAISFISSCKEKTNLEAEVIAIHDEVMPKMGDIHLAKKDLKKILTSSVDDSTKAEILNLLSNLENADEGMMEWMHNWKVPESEPERTDYLLKEKDKITKVKSDMLNSLEAAKNYIAKSDQK